MVTGGGGFRFSANVLVKPWCLPLSSLQRGDRGKSLVGKLIIAPGMECEVQPLHHRRPQRVPHKRARVQAEQVHKVKKVHFLLQPRTINMYRLGKLKLKI